MSMCISAMAPTNVVDTAAVCNTMTSTSQRWRSSLASGLRSALACTIVGLVSVYSPLYLRRHLTFPAFSYVVTVIIVTDATLGTSMRAAASALHATVMGAVPSVVALWLAHRTGAGESVLATAAVVALSTFAVSLPESPGAVAKRIALGQIIIIYVAKFRRGEHPDHELVLVHPVNVVVCTALGVVAALLAVLFPWPRLATSEVAEKTREYMETAAERVRVLVDAFLLIAANEQDDDADSNSNMAAVCVRRRRRWYMAAYMSQANRLASASAGILQRISSVKGDLQWERAGVLAADYHLQERIEVPIKGMEIALRSCCNGTSSTTGVMCWRSSSSSWAQQMRDQIRLALLTTTHHTPSIKLKPTSPSSCSTINNEMPAAAERHQDLAPFLFLFCMDLLHRGGSGSGSGSGTTPPTPNNKDMMPADTTTAARAPQDKITNSKVTPSPAAATQDGDHVFRLSDQEQVSREDQDDHQQQQGQDVEEEEEEQHHQPYDDDCEHANSSSFTNTNNKQKKKKKMITGNNRSTLLRWERVFTAVKCAVSLGLAVLLGLLFNNDHGFWSGLIVATTMTAGRDSTWALGIARAHGTAIGSVYGVLACLISQQRGLMELRFLALLPWIVLCTFLKRSRAYGPAGGIAAALSGIIIVGRRYDEPPMAFTITRLVETFIGLGCTVAADLVFQPKARPSARASAQLARCIVALRQCCTDASAKQHKKMKEHVALLSKYVREAESEPSFLWLAPFPASCYDKVQGNLSRMVQLLGLYLHARATNPTNGHRDSCLGAAISRFQSCISASMDEITHEPPTFEEEDDDLEAGKGICEEPKLVLQSFLGHAREALQEEEDADERNKLAVCFGSIGFCMGEMIKEAHQLEAHMLELRLVLQG